VSTEHFDLVIVGTGSGNALVTPDFDDWRIAIVEQGVFGGTCVNVGCIPTKMFVYPADQVADAREWKRLNLFGAPPRVDWRALRDRVFTRIDATTEIYTLSLHDALPISSTSQVNRSPSR